MNQSARHIYEFSLFQLDARERLLLRDGASVPLTPKAFDLRLALVEEHGHLSGKEDLLRHSAYPQTVAEKRKVG